MESGFLIFVGWLERFLIEDELEACDGIRSVTVKLG